MATKRISLLENYKGRLTEAENVYKATHNGKQMGFNTKVATAVLLNNVNKALTEAYDTSVGTQRSDMGAYKKFCLSITNVVFPSLIAEDLVIVKPMTSYSGVIAYAKYTYGSNKGGIKQGQVIADPWSIKARNEDNMRYTSEAIAEGAAVGTDFAATWTPIVTGVFDDNGTAYDAKIVATVSDGTTTTTTVTYANFVDGVIDGSNFPAANSGETVTYKVGYQYDNVKIPQNDLPIVNVEMANLPLIAKARRVAIYYSQIAAYQASTDYGFDMGKDLAQKAVAELAFEIDEEIIHFLADLGRKDGNYLEELEFNKTVPTGVSKRDHYESFIENIESAKVAIYNRTQKFMPSYMLAASDILPILAFIPGFKGASLSNIAGPFMAGTVQGLKVFVSPSLGQGEWFLGINGNDLSTSAAVYAPYMPIVPTQLVGYADGGMSQGFSTMYDLKALNEQLVVGSKIVKKPQPIDVNVNN